ncbi:3-phosphoshikimate 1-carboxyvinyltransferase [Campylobacter curvus]|uniref:3-phosphoshikimate 1-carboxyvinyltransferase n=1 Tax=Campylobacter curvus (strain 525.92) TaxID=360105 RepID=AROA_CAMC5|nr:3-phosphoshikimate 1-carboxyvinyltransferase [Campylobacter curvus]A7GXB4.1 RecName: Full=3-phosphoshikimate 1-carboxyvinyltransferase; AltName: Full=5-enolpyruvylshikimate-3-phosphate synthase; Short=EPSP synthase; Short=EPSPS [Campylobacter curvus 525.92]EAU00796.1 3-phosphoshikimate 1-carboxyvinyltransferase [Campylobacter curvus 525.92]
MKVRILNEPINVELSRIAADKSISHRCAIFSLLSDKPSHVRNYLKAGDTLNTLDIVRTLGAQIQERGEEVIITPPEKILEPDVVLECGNSGTSMRLFMGLLAAQDGFFVLSGDKYLNRRPMARVAKPLVAVGAKIDGANEANTAPLCIRGKKLERFKYDSPVASAQVKSALLLAALYSNGCEFSEPELSRDHTERMLKGMGAKIKTQGASIALEPMSTPLAPLDIDVPNDPSSAFFFAVAACIIPNSHIVLKNVLLNETRIEAYKILQKMGADIKFKEISGKYESIGDIEIRYAALNAVEVSENISWLIDEAPALAIAFANAKGTSVLKNAKELRVKECDRIAVTVAGLKKCGIKARELEDGFEVSGSDASCAIIDSHGDHRIAMSFAVLGLKCGMIIEKSEFIATSFPNFVSILRKIGASVED